MSCRSRHINQNQTHCEGWRAAEWGGTGKKEWKKGGKTRSSYNKTPRGVSQVETAICVRRQRVAGREKEREKLASNILTRERKGDRSIGRIYICMSAEGTMYSNCEKKGCTFRGKVIQAIGKKCDRLVNEARWSIEWISMGCWDERLRLVWRSTSSIRQIHGCIS